MTPFNEAASLISGLDLEHEFLKARESLQAAPTTTSLRAFAVICAVAIARVKVLERELSAVGHRARAARPERKSGHAAAS
jgi:hypothetical protein